MKYDKIMAGGNLCNIVERLTACIGLLHVIHSNMPADARYLDLSEALYAACDLLEMITRDFQADIDAAEDYEGAEE